MIGSRTEASRVARRQRTPRIEAIGNARNLNRRNAYGVFDSHKYPVQSLRVRHEPPRYYYGQPSGWCVCRARLPRGSVGRGATLGPEEDHNPRQRGPESRVEELLRTKHLHSPLMIAAPAICGSGIAVTASDDAVMLSVSRNTFPSSSL